MGGERGAWSAFNPKVFGARRLIHGDTAEVSGEKLNVRSHEELLSLIGSLGGVAD